jgi:hypothetical protein
MLDKDDIRSVIAETIKEVDGRNQQSSFQFAKPTTLRGWMFCTGAFVAGVSFIYTFIVYLHKISEHHKAPHHVGAEKLVERIETAVIAHTEDDDLHHREADLELRILRQTEPMKRDIQEIRQDMGTIKTKMDILIGRDTR